MKKKLALTAAKYLGLFALSRWLTRRRIRILAYHGIWFSPRHFGNHLFMNPDKFDSRMAWLADSPYSVISLEQALAAIGSSRMPRNAVVITIDDGWYGTFRYMLPAFEKHGLPATLYVYTGKVESQQPLLNILIPALLNLSDADAVRMTHPVTGSEIAGTLSDPDAVDRLGDELVAVAEALTGDAQHAFCSTLCAQLGFDYDEVLASRQFGFMRYDEIEDADRRGLDVQLHTHSHYLDPDQPGHVGDEIRVNREKLRPHVHSSLRHFCYPSGVYSEAMFAELAQNGVDSATLVDTGLVRAGDQPFALKRILDGQRVDLVEFEAELSGFMQLARDLRQAIGRS